MNKPLFPSEEAPSETEARILEAAHRVFIRRGTAGARTQEIADEAGVNKALLHYYFRSKEKLAEAVFFRAFRTLFPDLARTLAAEISLEEKVRRIVDWEITFLQENPYLPGYILSEFQYRPEVQRERLRKIQAGIDPKIVLDQLQAQIDREVATGEIHPISAIDFVVNLIGLIVFPFAAAPMLDVFLGLKGVEFHEMIERRKNMLADFILRGLKA